MRKTASSSCFDAPILACAHCQAGFLRLRIKQGVIAVRLRFCDCAVTIVEKNPAIPSERRRGGPAGSCTLEGFAHGDRRKSFTVRALLLGERLETRGLERDDTLATNPFTLRVGRQGMAFCSAMGSRYLPGYRPSKRTRFCAPWEPGSTSRWRAPETDQIQVHVNPKRRRSDRAFGRDSRSKTLLSNGSRSSPTCCQRAWFSDIMRPVLLASSTVSSRLRRDCSARGRTGSQAKELLQQIGDVLFTQHRMVGRVEVEEKPDVLWDHPELERLYARLEDEYELVERSRAMERKLALISADSRDADRACPKPAKRPARMVHYRPHRPGNTAQPLRPRFRRASH